MNAYKCPVLLGKIHCDNGRTFLRNNFDEIVHVEKDDAIVLKEMNGYLSFEEIAQKCGYDKDIVENVFDKYKGKRSLVSLYEWNSLHWCSNCHTYVTDVKCGICKKKTQKLIFSPPCDPSLCSPAERALINEKANECGLQMPDDAFYIVNTGVYNGEFFWEVAYSGKVIFRLDFSNEEPSSWSINLLVEKIEILQLPLSCDSQEQMQRVFLANALKQEFLISNAMDFIEYAYGIFNSKPLLYFSAGKESMVIYSLLKHMKKNANVLTVTTGVDFPEDYQFMRQMQKVLSQDEQFTNYFFESDGNEAIEYLNSVGKLSISDPWCRLLIKKKQKNLGTKHIYHGENFVAFEGTRWYETNFRRSNPMVNILQEYPNQVWVSPIIGWTSFDVWVYLLSKQELVNPVYSLGFQRTTCWLCPAVNPYAIYLSKKYYPDLWDKIKDCKLDAFAGKDDREVIY